MNLQVRTGSTSRTVWFDGQGGFVTYEPPPLCEECKKPMQPLVWLCGCCGAVS